MNQDAAASRAEAALAGYALAYRVLLQRAVPENWEVPMNVAATLGSLALAHRSGASLSECGVGRKDVRAGLRTGAGAAAVTAAGILVASLSRPVLRMFREDRISAHSRARSAYEVLVRIPLGTALGEEVLFRGAVLGVMLRRRSPGAAAAWNALWFGAWHVPPILVSVRSASLGKQMKGSICVVCATAAAGMVLAELRLRSRSVLAPALAHAALNGTAYLVARRASGVARQQAA